MTEKLYWKHPYDTQFEAKVVKIIKEGIILDKTLFYPRSGNQANDIGQIIFNDEKIEVKNVYSEGKEIIHEIHTEKLKKFKVGKRIKGVLDWENRYALMKAHTSQHILSALFKNKYGINTSRAFIEREEVLIQLEKDIEEFQLQEVLIEFFTLCSLKNIHIKPNIFSLDEAQELGNNLRGNFPSDEMIRIVEIENLDLNCCGGTHIKNSTEIGSVLIIEFKKKKDIKYLLGNKAIQRFSQINMELLNLSDQLNTPLENYARDVKKAIELNQTLLTYQDLLINEFFKQKILNPDVEINMDLLNLTEKLNTPLENYARDVKKAIELNQTLLTYQDLLISEFFKQKILNPDVEINDIKLYLINMEIEYKSLKKILDQLPKNSLLLIKSEENKIRIISNTDEIKSDEIAEKLIKNYRGKGGGNPRNAQCLLERKPKDILRDIQSFIKL